MGRKTSAEIIFRIFDVTAALEAVPKAAGKQNFSNLETLCKEDLEFKKYGTLEYNQFVLDGTFNLFPDNPSVENFGLWSSSMSDAVGNFANPPKLEFTFAQNHSSLGLTLHFDAYCDDHCDHVTVKWFGSDDVLLFSGNYHPNVPMYFAEARVEGYRKVEVEFFSTKKPYRYIKLNSVNFGLNLPVTGSNLLSANLLEEVDPTSAEISINTLNFSVFSVEGNFSVTNPTGYYDFLQRKQRVDAYEYVNGVKQYMGAFYLDEPESTNEKSTNMGCLDMVGILDQTYFKGGIYKDKKLSDLLEDIRLSAGAGVVFDVSADLVNELINGYIQICTHREALQQIAFALGAVVDCSRSYTIKMYIPDKEAIHQVDIGRKIDDHSVKQKSLVTSVAVTSHTYVVNEQAAELFKGNLEVGEHEITFNSPAHTLTVTGATIVTSGANYALINVVEEQEVVITGKGYVDNLQAFKAMLANIPTNERMNEVAIDQATLICPVRAQAVADNLLGYYQNRLEDTGKILLANESVGDNASLKMVGNKAINGTIESLEIDLVGGFLASGKITGKAVQNGTE